MSTTPVREEMPYRRCVGVVVFNAAGKVWAGRRIIDSETPMSHRWQLPQGGIDKGEDTLLAARRELFEETGIQTVELLAESAKWLNYDLPDEILGTGLKGKYRGQTQKWFAFRFQGDESEINISEPPDGAEPEFDKWEWKNLRQMADLVVPFKRELYLDVISEFEKFSDE